jgi:hypothetical protein
VHKLDSSELALRIQDPRVLLLSYVGIGDPVVFDGRVEVVVDGGCDPDDSAGIFGGGGRDEQRVEESDEEEVAEDICAELEIELLSGELVDWWGHHSGVRNQHVQLGLLPTIRKSVKLSRSGRKWGDVLEELLSGFLGSIQIAQVELKEDGLLAGLLLEFFEGSLGLGL